MKKLLFFLIKITRNFVPTNDNKLAPPTGITLDKLAQQYPKIKIFLAPNNITMDYTIPFGTELPGAPSILICEELSDYFFDGSSITIRWDDALGTAVKRTTGSWRQSVFLIANGTWRVLPKSGKKQFP